MQQLTTTAPQTPILPRSFYARDAATVARDLVGSSLIRRLPDRTLRVRIVETEAYVGSHDLASHASKGRTARTAVMFGPPGHAYVYLIYGMYHMLNIVTGEDGDAQAVLIRAAEPLAEERELGKDRISENTMHIEPTAADDPIGPLNGPGRLTKSLSITMALNRLDLCDPDDPPLALAAGRPPTHIVTAPRIGVDYAGEWAAAPLRFYDPDSRHVSRR